MGLECLPYICDVHACTIDRVEGNSTIHACTVSDSKGARTKSPTRKSPPKLSQKEREEELQRKLEMNQQAFEAWLEPKKEEQRVRSAQKLGLSLFDLYTNTVPFARGSVKLSIGLLRWRWSGGNSSKYQPNLPTRDG